MIVFCGVVGAVVAATGADWTGVAAVEPVQVQAFFTAVRQGQAAVTHGQQAVLVEAGFSVLGAEAVEAEERLRRGAADFLLREARGEWRAGSGPRQGRGA